MGFGIDANRGGADSPKYAFLPQSHDESGGLSADALVEFCSMVLGGKLRPSLRSEAIASATASEGIHNVVWNEWNSSVSDVRMPILLLAYPTRQSPSFTAALQAIKPLAKAKVLEGVLRVATVSGVNNHLPDEIGWPRYNHGGKVKLMLLPEGVGLEKLSRLSHFKGEISTAAIARALSPRDPSVAKPKAFHSSVTEGPSDSSISCGTNHYERRGEERLHA